jgi:acyl-CoA synthetase (AMP-forming)/AMP-acid ligase II
MDAERSALTGRVAALIDDLGGTGRDDARRDALLLDLARWQARAVEPYRRLLAARGVSAERASSPGEVPALPTDVFRHVRVASHTPANDQRVFRTSGTLSGARGVHHLRTLALYDRAARSAAQAAFFPDHKQLRLVSLVPTEREAPDSSLAYMIARFFEWFGAADSCTVWRSGRLDVDALAAALDRAAAERAPVALLGTAFAFVHAEDALGERRWRLAPGSRLLYTGGVKGRSREVEPTRLRKLLAARYDMPESSMIAEYGMTELSSQIYETPLAETRVGRRQPRRLVPPGWMRVVIVDPETLMEKAAGVGLVRIEDAANLDTAWAIQTSDLGQAVAPDGFELLGRAPGATLRGCSLAVEEALGR